MAVKEAIKVIYSHEQARQGRSLFNEAQKLYEIKQENRLKELRKNFKRQISDNVAACRIQRVNITLFQYFSRNIYLLKQIFCKCIFLFIIFCFNNFFFYFIF